MYIYKLNSENNEFTRMFNVSTQVCATCALLSAKNIINNYYLSSNIGCFIADYRQEIIKHVNVNDAVFITSNNNGLLVIKQAEPVKQKNICELKNTIPYVNLNAIKSVNTKFHNHSDLENVGLQLNSKDTVLTVYNTAVFRLFY